jgi:acetyltransferase
MNREAAQYTVIVVDRWQGRGLGRLMTGYCLEVAKAWGVKRVVAETSKQNARMVATFRSLGFHESREPVEGVVFVHKDVD